MFFVCLDIDFLAPFDGLCNTKEHDEPIGLRVLFNGHVEWLWCYRCTWSFHNTVTVSTNVCRCMWQEQGTLIVSHEA